MQWLAMGWHFVGSIVQCCVTHSSEITKLGLDLTTCVTGKFFGV